MTNIVYYGFILGRNRDLNLGEDGGINLILVNTILNDAPINQYQFS